MVMNSLLKETSSVAQYDKNINMHNKKSCFIYSVQVNWRSKSYQARKRGGAHYLSGHWGLSFLSLRLSAAAWSVLQSGALNTKSRRGRHGWRHCFTHSVTHRCCCCCCRRLKQGGGQSSRELSAYCHTRLTNENLELGQSCQTCHIVLYLTLSQFDIIVSTVWASFLWMGNVLFLSKPKNWTSSNMSETDSSFGNLWSTVNVTALAAGGPVPITVAIL